MVTRFSSSLGSSVGVGATSRFSRLSIVFVVALLLAAAVSVSIGAATASACSENGSLFWGDSTQGYGGTGTRQTLTIRSHSNGGCSGGGLVAGGTAHMSPYNGGGSLAEIGWRDYTDSSGTHSYTIFAESCFYNTGCDIPETSHNAQCAAPGDITVYIKSTSAGGSTYNSYYKCGTYGYTQLSSDSETFSYAEPRVETFRAGPSGGGGFILDYHSSLQHWDSYGNLVSQMGQLVCRLGMSDTYGVPNGNPATAWQTSSTGSC